MDNYHYNLIPFREIQRFWTYRTQLGVWSYINLFGNIIIFIPFGFFEPLASAKRSILVTVVDGCLMSLVVEIFQFVTKVGRFDIDDLMLNTMGVVMGYICFLIWNRMRSKHDAKRKSA